MKENIRIASLIAACLLTPGLAIADKPSWAGEGGKHEKEKNDKKGRKSEDRDEASSMRFTSDMHRIVSDYYGQQARSGHCPPGLAKKNNGCLPPGQAKKWAKGRPLPADLRYHDLPYDLLRRLPPPPPRHRYVQVAGDVLMIAIGSSMVIDAIEDILR